MVTVSRSRDQQRERLEASAKEMCVEYMGGRSCRGG